MHHGLGVGSRLSDYLGLPDPGPDENLTCQTAAIEVEGVDLWLFSEVPFFDVTARGGSDDVVALPIERDQIVVTARRPGAGGYFEGCPALPNAQLPATE